MVPDYVYHLQEKALREVEVNQQEEALVENLLRWATLAQAGGVASLADEAESLRESDPFLWQHLRSWIDGVDVELCKELILSQMSLHADEPGVLLHELVCFWGIFDLRRGVSPGFMAQRLALFVGAAPANVPPPPPTPTSILPNLDALLVPDDLEEL